MISLEHPDFTALPGSSRLPVLPVGPAADLPPLVQVVSVARGRASTLPDTWRSLRDQTLARWVWTIADRTDGSFRARDVMASLGREARARVVPVASDEIGSPLNIASAGTAPYLCLLRPGDLIEPTTLETWVWALATSGADAISSAVVTFGMVQRTIRVDPVERGGFPSDNRPPATLLVTRSAFDRIGRIDPAWSADEDIEGLAVLLAMRGHRVHFLPTYHVWRRVTRPGDPPLRIFGTMPRPPAELPHQRPARFEVAPVLENPLRGEGRAVLFLIPYMFRGGAERVALDQARELTARGWRVTVVATNRAEHNWHAAFAAVTPDVHVLTACTPSWGEWDTPIRQAPRLLSYLIESRGIDAVVVSGTIVGYGLVPWLRHRHPGLGVTAVRHGVDWPLLTADILALVDMVVVSTETLIGAHIAAGVPADRVRRVVTGIDLERWRPSPERRAVVRGWLSLPGDAVVIAYCSRLDYDKQPLVFAETLGELDRRGCEFHAVVVGHGPQLPALRDRLERLGLTERVRLLGAVDDRTLPDVIAAADVAFLPSQREGISMALLEGMASGLPFVGTSNSSQGEVITDDVGRLVARSTPEGEALAYADALAAIIGDRSALAAMAVRARARIDEAWSFAAMGDQLVSAIEAAIANASRRSATDDLAAFPAAMAALTLHASWADSVIQVNQTAERLRQVLTGLGFDAEGRPLPGTKAP